MSDLPFGLLEALASKSEQDQYIARQTVDEYLIPEELLNDAWHFCERAFAVESSLNSRQLEAVAALKSAIQSAPPDLEDRPDLVDDLIWATIRALARTTLAAFDQPLPV